MKGSLESSIDIGLSGPGIGISWPWGNDEYGWGFEAKHPKQHFGTRPWKRITMLRGPRTVPPRSRD